MPKKAVIASLIVIVLALGCESHGSYYEARGSDREAHGSDNEDGFAYIQQQEAINPKDVEDEIKRKRK